MISSKDLKKADWIEISAFIPGRNDIQCLYRCNEGKKDCLKKSVWTKTEDDELVRLIEKYGPKQWSYLAMHLNNFFNDNSIAN